MRGLEWRYAVVCVLVGVVVCAVVGAITGAVVVLLGGQDAEDTGPLLGVAFGSTLAGLIIGAALGVLLGGLSGVASTLAVGPRTALGQVCARVGISVLLTYLVLLTVLAGLGEGGWRPPPTLYWAGVVVPSVLAAWLASRAARQIPGME